MRHSGGMVCLRVRDCYLEELGCDLALFKNVGNFNHPVLPMVIERDIISSWYLRSGVCGSVREVKHPTQGNVKKTVVASQN